MPTSPLPGDDAFERRLAALRRLPRAAPSRDLLAGIEARIARPAARVVSLAEWWAIAAAAVLLLGLNLFALLYSSAATAPGETADDDTYALVTDYQLYD